MSLGDVFNKITRVQDSSERIGLLEREYRVVYRHDGVVKSLERQAGKLAIGARNLQN